MMAENRHSLKHVSGQPQLANDSLNELRVMRSIWRWRNPTNQPRGLIPIRRSHWRKVKRKVVKQQNTKGRHTEHRASGTWGFTVLFSIRINMAMEPQRKISLFNVRTTKQWPFLKLKQKKNSGTQRDMSIHLLVGL